MQTEQTRVRSTQHVSLDAVEARALRQLAQDERFGNVSAAVGRLIRNEMTRRYGVNWSANLDDVDGAQ